MMAGRVRIPKPGEDAVCEDCGLTYYLDAFGDPKTAEAFTCDDCGGAVEAVPER